jgi:hypothetical protein
MARYTKCAVSTEDTGPHRRNKNRIIIWLGRP